MFVCRVPLQYIHVDHFSFFLLLFFCFLQWAHATWHSFGWHDSVFLGASLLAISPDAPTLVYHLFYYALPLLLTAPHPRPELFCQFVIIRPRIDNTHGPLSEKDVMTTYDYMYVLWCMSQCPAYGSLMLLSFRMKWWLIWAEYYWISPVFATWLKYEDCCFYSSVFHSYFYVTNSGINAENFWIVAPLTTQSLLLYWPLSFVLLRKIRRATVFLYPRLVCGRSLIACAWLDLSAYMP